MIKKNFDCVEMKNKGAESIAEKIFKLSPQDELEFWKSSTQNLMEAKNALENKREKEIKKHPGALSSL